MFIYIVGGHAVSNVQCRVGVFVLYSVERHGVCTVHCRETHFVYCRV